MKKVTMANQYLNQYYQKYMRNVNIIKLTAI